MIVRAGFALLALVAGSHSANAAEFEDLAGIERQVATYVGGDSENLGDVLVPIDRRLRLAACPAALDIAWHGLRRDSVRVSCPLAGGWRIFVRLAQPQQSLAATQPVIRRGDAVTITLNAPGLSISRSGEALENGAVGEWVRVRVGKDEERRAQVLRPGAVGMKLP